MKKNILVTGAHRSGTTWTGRVIEQTAKMRYVQEPFNRHEAGKHSPLRFMYEHLATSTPEQQRAVKNYLATYFQRDYATTVGDLKQIRSLHTGYDFLKEHWGRWTAERTIIKDPLALMSAEWLHQQFDWQVVVLTRHPAAFVASIKIKNWRFNFRQIDQQRAFVRQHLPEYATTIKKFAQQQPDIIQQGILLWNITNQMVLQYREKYADEWYFVRHEDLSTAPQTEFAQLFNFLHLPFTERVKKYLTATTAPAVESEWKRQAATNIYRWKERLTAAEIAQIKQETQAVWQHFYTEAEW